MFLVVGLGNPGSEYAGTRHNVGFDVVDELASKLGLAFSTRSSYAEASGRHRGRGLVLLKPMTYMNNSGATVRDAALRHRAGANGVLVVCDDFHLPLGTLRLRLKGSDGGHNGLTSVIGEMGTTEFPRLRCGIAGASLPRRGTADYVLSRFDDDEEPAVRTMVAAAAAAVLASLREGMARAMNTVNVTQQ